MKKVAFIFGSLFISLLIIGTLLKILHLNYGGILLITGLVGLAVIFIPSLSKVLYDKMK